MEFLFDKLASGERTPENAEARLRASVWLQLDWLVGTREWQAERSSDYLIDVCMPSVESLSRGVSSQLERYALRLRRLIEKHEPRLKQVTVELQPTGRTLQPYKIVVAGVLDRSTGESQFQFESEPSSH